MIRLYYLILRQPNPVLCSNCQDIELYVNKKNGIYKLLSAVLGIGGRSWNVLPKDIGELLYSKCIYTSHKETFATDDNMETTMQSIKIHKGYLHTWTLTTGDQVSVAVTCH